MEKIRVSAKTKDEAITKALIQLRTTSDRLSYNVLVQGSAGLFGIGAKPWILEAFVKEESEELNRLEEEIRNINTGKLREAEEKQSEEKASNKAAAKEKDGGKEAPERKPENPEGRRSEDRRKEERASERNLERNSERAPEKKPEGFRKASESSEKGRPERKDRREERSAQTASRPDRTEKQFSRGGYGPALTARDERQEKSEKPEISEKREIHPVSEEEAQAVTEKAVSFIRSVLAGMGMEVNVSSSFRYELNELLVNLEGPDMGILIGKRGQTLDSLQYLCSLVVNREHKEDYVRIKLDTEDYRKRREQTLRTLAKNISYKVKRSRKPVALEPMNPYERRIIHSALQGDRFTSTRSEGEEPFRHVVIFCKNGSDTHRRSGYSAGRVREKREQ